MKFDEITKYLGRLAEFWYVVPWGIIVALIVLGILTVVRVIHRGFDKVAVILLIIVLGGTFVMVWWLRQPYR